MNTKIELTISLMTPLTQLRTWLSMNSVFQQMSK